MTPEEELMTPTSPRGHDVEQLCTTWNIPESARKADDDNKDKSKKTTRKHMTERGARKRGEESRRLQRRRRATARAIMQSI